VEASVVASVELRVESDDDARSGSAGAIHVRMLGAMTVHRGGVQVTLPPSRKLRALFAYLALAPSPVTRSQLCELLWDIPDDPRGELRWCLSKLRKIVDDPGRRRVHAREDTLWLDLPDCFVDAIEIARAADAGIATLDAERQRSLCTLLNGDFLEGLEIDRSPAFTGWLTAQRRRFRAFHAALLEHLVKRVPDDDAFEYLEQWLRLSPHDPQVHELLLTALARRGRIREGEEHVAATARLFEADGLDWTPIRNAWRSVRAQTARTSPEPLATPFSANVAGSGADDGDIAGTRGRRASIAVMPFIDHSTAAAAHTDTAGALAHDVIARLAKLRSLFVIAEGTVFALHERGIGPDEAGRMLGVDYVARGSVRHQDTRFTVTVELIDTRTARIVWTDVFDEARDNALLVLDVIGNRIVASIAGEIERVERDRAILRPPNSLDAWEAHHRGLWHMYRFSKADNERAQHFFETAVRLDPTFARAYAGLSFTHFQNVFQGWAAREPEMDRAFNAAGQSLMADDRDPAAHWAMGRALWLRGSHDQSVIELERAIDLSPNFALGHYTLAFVHSQTGDPNAAISSSDYSRQLSPFDPMLFAMLGASAMALVRLERFEEAARWGVKAATRPNAHQHILAIAAFSLALAGSLDDARTHAAAIRRMQPGYDIADFLAAMRMDAHGVALFREGARRIGMG
jgi:DNA-binding SARP family transcriptional activator